MSKALNYEANAQHSIIVRATDKGGLFKTKRFTVKVVDVNEQPTVTTAYQMV